MKVRHGAWLIDDVITLTLCFQGMAWVHSAHFVNVNTTVFLFGYSERAILSFRRPQSNPSN